MKNSTEVIKAIENYLLVEEIKKGEKATIYLALNNRNDKLFVAKAFSNEYVIKDNEGNTNIKLVVQNLRKLKHENIIRIKDHKVTSNNNYIFTEYCNGGNLSDYQNYYIQTKKSQINEFFIQKIIRQIIAGLEFIHNQHIIHGDIDIQNILINFDKYPNIAVGGVIPPKVKYSDVTLNDNFTLKISDLDLSKKEGKQCSGSALITDCPSNMAPEIVKSILNNEPNEACKNKIDLWSLGEMTYELLTGQHAFSGKDNNDIFNKIMEGKYFFPTTQIISYEIILFINGLLQFCPESRMNWEQIKAHPFITKNVEQFKFLKFNDMGDNKNAIEINSKDGSSLFYIFSNSRSSSYDFGDIHTNINENEKKRIENKITEKIVNNKEIEIALEEKKKKNLEEKKRLNKERKDAEKLRKESSQQLDGINIFRKIKGETEKKIKELKKELEEELNPEEEQKKKEELNKLQEEINIMISYNNEYNENFNKAIKLFLNAEKIKIKAEKGLVLMNIKEVFSNENLCSLKTETKLIEFFTLKIDECYDYNVSLSGKNQFLNVFTLKNIEEIFKTHPSIKEISNNIYSKLSKIKVDEIQSEDEYNNKIMDLFGDIKLPEFLTDKDLKKIRSKSFSNKRNGKIINLIKNTLERNFTHESELIIETFEKMRDNKIKVFEGINKKKELINLFIIVNSKVFNKIYCEEKFITFLDDNNKLIQEYFGEDMKYEEILENFSKMTEEESISKKRNLAKIIENDINSKKRKLYIIVCSFYYLLLYKFQDLKQAKNNNNFGNIYINIILKNIIIFLDQNLKNLGKNLFILLNQLYLFDINNSIYKDKKNEIYTFEKINSLLLEAKKKLKTKFIELKNEYFENQGLFRKVKQIIDQHFELDEDLAPFQTIKLIPLDEKVYSNTITIIIDNFSNKDQNQIDEWNDFINYFDKETMFYYFQWSQEILLQKGNYKTAKKLGKYLKANIKQAKMMGKLLAYILISKKFFGEFQINLVGFSLGCYVIKECIKKLSKINNKKYFVKIKNVILIGAAMHIKTEKKWKDYIEETIIDKFINCYSNKDEILKSIYKKYSENSGKNPIGIDSLEIKNEKGNNLIANYNFSENNFDQLSYNLETVAKKVFENYKDI